MGCALGSLARRCYRLLVACLPGWLPIAEDRAAVAQIGGQVRELPPRLRGLLLDRAAEVRDHRREFGAAASGPAPRVVAGLPGHVADVGADVLDQLLAALVGPVEILPQAKECIGKNCHDRSPLGMGCRRRQAALGWKR